MIIFPITHLMYHHRKNKIKREAECNQPIIKKISKKFKKKLLVQSISKHKGPLSRIMNNKSQLSFSNTTNKSLQIKRRILDQIQLFHLKSKENHLFLLLKVVNLSTSDLEKKIWPINYMMSK